METLIGIWFPSALTMKADRLITGAPDSMVRWGYLDAIFERIEYVESYVIEDMIREMVADNPDLLNELEDKMKSDKEFADDPWAIRYWFYEKTPYYDQQVGVYPVGMIDTRQVVQKLKIEYK